jgi:hypothetical protein
MDGDKERDDQGKSGEDDGDLPPPDPGDRGAANGAAFSCDERAVPAPQPMRRLSDRQYRNTVRDLIERVLGQGSSEARAVMETLAQPLAAFPENEHKSLPEEPHGSYRRLDLDIRQEHIDATYDLAKAAAQALTAAQNLGKAVGGCATNNDATDDDACLGNFISRFGLLALRRPPTASESAFYRKVYGADARASSEAYADVIGTFLMAPQFVFRVESGEREVDRSPSMYELGAYEMAARLSYQFWDTMPDDDLFAAAASGKLENPEGYAEEVDRLLSDARARDTMQSFFGDWLRLDEIPDPYQRRDEPIFKKFAGDNVPTATLREEIRREVTDMVQWLVIDQGRPLADLLVDDHVLVRGPALAKNYGVRPWDGESEPETFPEGERPGLLTRAAFHGFGSANTRPVMKGVFVRKHLLCDDLPPPPADVMVEEPVAIDGKSTRQVVEAITEQKGTACFGCHAHVINPIGFATENIDALGRLRAEQDLYDDDGNVLATVPVNTRATPQIMLGDVTEIDGAAGLATLVAESGRVEACMARQYLRFTFSRWDSLEADGCALERLRRKVATGGAALDLLREIAFTSAFRHRVIP